MMMVMVVVMMMMIKKIIDEYGIYRTVISAKHLHILLIHLINK